MTQIQFNKDVKVAEIKKTIEKVADLTDSFKPIKQEPTCGNCGMKDEKMGEKCPNCKSPYII